MRSFETEAALREVMGEAMGVAVEKVLDHVDQHIRHFISLSPFLTIGTSRADGQADVSPRGDPPGFVMVVDERTLLIPERPGNRRLDTLTNIIANPQVGLLFFVPGINETVRINGTAEVVDDPERLAALAVRGKVPQVGLLVHVQEAFMHCAKALVRSKLWTDEHKVERSSYPSLGQIIVDQAKEPSLSVSEADELVEENYRTELY